jgi:Icc-related predicted phosphoesterase
MKILAAADIHGSQYRLNLILKNIKTYSPDLVVLCGDITQFGPGELATSLLNQIPIKIFAIPGNIDTFDVDQGIITSNATYLHMRRVVFQGIPFVGLGRDIPRSLANATILNGTQKKSLMNTLDKTSVLVTHSPPFKLQDKIFMGSHGGSKELRNLIDIHKPCLVLCGHIHEDPGMTKLMNTTVVNCSMGKRTEGALIEITDKIKVAILD